MISSGESMLEVAGKLKSLGANKIYVCCAFGLFCNGLEIFDKAYEEGTIEKILTTNLIYRNPGLSEREWFEEIDMSKYIAFIVDAINHDASIGPLLDPSAKIQRILKKHNEELDK